jgi:hypothetical protein
MDMENGQVFQDRGDTISATACFRLRNAPAGKRALTIQEVDPMLYTIAVVLIILWLLGLVSGYTMGNFIHILLVIALVVIVVRIIQGRRPV